MPLRSIHLGNPGPDDEVIGDILVRVSILRKIPREKFIALILRRVKPLMDDSEVIHLDIEAELILEEQL